MEVVVLLLVDVEVDTILLDISTVVETIWPTDPLLRITSLVEGLKSFVEVAGFGMTVVTGLSLELVVTMVPTTDDLIEDDDATKDDVVISLLVGEADTDKAKDVSVITEDKGL